MKTVFHENKSRGLADHGWLVSRHTFSFGGYQNPERMGFGLLRVINDDRVAPAMGFGTHPHDNMEIISIPLKGLLEHKDSMGNSFTISAGEVQVMSAGTGVTHSEYNGSESEEVEFLQIWVQPRKRDIEPRYDQKNFDTKGQQDSFQVIVSPEGGGGVTINQTAWFSLASLTEGKVLHYKKQSKENGVYFFVLEGRGFVAEQKLAARDGLGVVDGNDIRLEASSGFKLLVMEVPMQQ